MLVALFPLTTTFLLSALFNAYRPNCMLCGPCLIWPLQWPAHFPFRIRSSLTCPQLPNKSPTIPPLPFDLLARDTVLFVLFLSCFHPRPLHGPFHVVTRPRVTHLIGHKFLIDLRWRVINIWCWCCRLGHFVVCLFVCMSLNPLCMSLNPLIPINANGPPIIIVVIIIEVQSWVRNCGGGLPMELALRLFSKTLR